MRIGLIAMDSKRPNLALMRISAYHKDRGDEVEWAEGFTHYDKVYVSRIFNFTPEEPIAVSADEMELGGTGYDIRKVLPPEIERMRPDYSIYPGLDDRTAYGFLTRGCPNRCPWCVVPVKEGNIAPYRDVEEVSEGGRRTNLILMDNNILASDYGLNQIRKIADRGYRVDFNQAIDARLVTPDVADLLARVRWIDEIRLGCDSHSQIDDCETAMRLIDERRGRPARYLMYMMIGGKNDAMECYGRLSWFRGRKRVRVVAQPFRNPFKPTLDIPMWQKDMARWAMRRQLWTSCDFKDYVPRKGVRGSDYLNGEENE